MIARREALKAVAALGGIAAAVIAIVQEFIKLPDPSIWHEITPAAA